MAYDRLGRTLGYSGFTSNLPVPIGGTQTMPTSGWGQVINVAGQVIGGLLGQGSVGLPNPLPGLGQGGLPKLTTPSILLAGGRFKARRRMNVLNPHALRRSMRRVQGFAKFAKKTISFTKRVKMKKRRRS